MYSKILFNTSIVILYLLIWSAGSQRILMPGNVKIITDSFKMLTYDRDYFTEVRATTQAADFYIIAIKKDIPKLFFTLTTLDLQTKRGIVKLNKLDCCALIAQSLMSQLMRQLYEVVLVNATSMRCPIKTGHYLLRSNLSFSTVHMLHPFGSFSLRVKVNVNSVRRYLIDLLWTYRVMQVQ